MHEIFRRFPGPKPGWGRRSGPCPLSRHQSNAQHPAQHLGKGQPGHFFSRHDGDGGHHLFPGGDRQGAQGVSRRYGGVKGLRQLNALAQFSRPGLFQQQFAALPQHRLHRGPSPISPGRAAEGLPGRRF